MGQGKKNRKRRDNQVENGNGQVRQQDDEAKKLEKEIEEKEDNKLEEYGQVILEDNRTGPFTWKRVGASLFAISD